MFPNQWQAGLMWYLPQKNLKTLTLQSVQLVDIITTEMYRVW